MTEAAKIKAGIPTAKRRTKKPTKDEQIRELQARLAALEYPDEAAGVSKEPLVSLLSSRILNCRLIITQFTRDSSPEDVDLLVGESEVPTEADSNDFIVVGGKRIPSSSYNPR